MNGLIACAQNTTEPVQQSAAEHNIELGLAYLERGNIPRAQDKLTRAVLQDPHSAMAQSALAYFYMQTEQMDKAEVAYKKSIQLAPRDGAMYNNYGVFLCRQKKYAAANAAFIKAAEQPDYLQIDDAQQNAAQCNALQLTKDTTL